MEIECGNSSKWALVLYLLRLGFLSFFLSSLLGWCSVMDETEEGKRWMEYL